MAIEREGINPSYCCGALDYQLQSRCCPIRYNKKFREYSIKDSRSTSISIMFFCPNCATEFPTSLREQWFDILEKEYGLEDPDDEKEKIPKEFLTDEWWKKRGLEDNKKRTIYAGSFGNRPVQCLFWD
jgi:hypothetical protein